MTGRLQTAELWRDDIVRSVAAGERFAGLYGTAVEGGCRLTAILAVPGGFELAPLHVTPDADGELSYPSLTPAVPSAFWYERAAADLSELVPLGHPRPDPLLLPVEEGSHRPRPGHGGPHGETGWIRVATPAAPSDVTGRGIFTIAYGPVRSGVTESIEYLVETPGEDIPRLNIRPHFKHRGVAKAFEGRTPEDGVLVAERVEGIASVAHALAFSHAVEQLSGVRPPAPARLGRVILAELERIANHLDVAMRLADAAGLAVANTRFAWHKESVLRITGRLTGSRFGRATVVPGGLARPLRLGDPHELAAEVAALRERIRADARLAMKTPSFLDRLRSTGRLTPERAREWGALGPIGRASGFVDDDRWTRPADSYPELVEGLAPAFEESGDVLGRLRVRWTEVDTSVRLIERACAALARAGEEPFRVETAPDLSGLAVGWAEGPHGEVVHVVELDAGRIVRCFARTASLHDLALFHDIFTGDVLTDFAFDEFSFGLSAAGVAM